MKIMRYILAFWLLGFSSFSFAQYYENSNAYYGYYGYPGYNARGYYGNPGYHPQGYYGYPGYNARGYYGPPPTTYYYPGTYYPHNSRYIYLYNY